MDVRYAVDEVRFMRMTTNELRDSFLVSHLFHQGELQLLYWENERAILGSAVPTTKALTVEGGKEIASDHFTDRRELGAINVGASGSISVDGKTYVMEPGDCLYIGKGSRDIRLMSDSVNDPAAYYLLSYPAHMTYPTTHARKMDAEAVQLGSGEACNERTIYKYIHPDGIQSCQLVMGFTELKSGSVWNTMPAHTHERRTEIYFYFNLAEDDSVFHLMGRPTETRHLVIKNRQAVLSPIWSIHAGVGTGQYSFIWGMGGENQVFGDMDGIQIKEMK